MRRKKRRRRKQRRSPEEVMSTCAWCRRRIEQDSEIFSLGAKTKPGVELEEGSVIELNLMGASRGVSAVVPMDDSEAKREGNDMLFVICSEGCGAALKEELQAEIDIIDLVIGA